MNVLSLPNELLCLIFSDDNLNFDDLRHLMFTCQRFLEIIRGSNVIWSSKFNARWPYLASEKNQHETDWLALSKMRFKVAKQVRGTLQNMASLCYPEGEPSMAMMDELLANISHVDFVENELVELVFHQEKLIEKKMLGVKILTSDYYGQKVLRYLRTRKQEKIWLEFLRKPASEQSLLEGAVLISKWGQMDQEKSATLKEVESLLDNIVKRVLQCIEEQYGSYSNSFIIGNRVSDSDDPRMVKKVLSCINKVLYTEMGFSGNVEDYYSFSNSFIDKVLEHRKGIPITLCIIYHEVAKRLGIVCEPVSFPQHFLLRWREYPEREESESFTFIDAFNGGASHMPRSCPALAHQPRQHIRREAYSAVEPGLVFQRMANNLIQCSRVQWDHGRGDNNGLRNQLHFSRLACCCCAASTPIASQPHQQHYTLHPVVAYAELCVFLGKQLEEAMQLLQSEEYSEDTEAEDAEPGHSDRVRAITFSKCVNRLSYQKAQTDKKIVCHRSPSVRYAIGLIMRHVRLNYTCVIAFWDPRCQASEEWMERMGIRDLARGVDQPFYHVLVNDGSSRYAAEENLEVDSSPRPILHPDIGLHFESFNGHRYIPHTAKMRQYPEDEAVATQISLIKYF